MSQSNMDIEVREVSMDTEVGKVGEVGEVEQVVSEISARIASLTDFDGESLKGEMASLKKALLNNPSACALLLDKDIGLAVVALRRMTGMALASASSTKSATSNKQKKLTAAELAKLMAEVPDDDFL